MAAVSYNEAFALLGILPWGHQMNIKQRTPQIVPLIGFFHKDS